MIDFGRARLRSNPRLRLVPLDLLPEHGQAFEGLGEDADCFGVLVPPEETTAWTVGSSRRTPTALGAGCTRRPMVGRSPSRSRDSRRRLDPGRDPAAEIACSILLQNGPLIDRVVPVNGAWETPNVISLNELDEIRDRLWHSTGALISGRNPKPGFLASGVILPRTKSSISTGTSDTPSIAAKNIEKVFVNASGLNKRPS